MKYTVSSFWAGRYSKTKYGSTDLKALAVWWFISWSILEFLRVLRLNKYHYGNIFCLGEKLTDCYGRKVAS